MGDAPKFAVGDRVKIVSLVTLGLDPDLGIDRYTDKIGKVGTVHDITSMLGTDITVYRLRFDHPRGSVLLDPFYDDELEAVQ